tara:strand:- start:178 stop:600 length:423 start_codon:yes stop_codon:yes gene_type:complete
LDELLNRVSFAYENVEEAFPVCDPGVKPLGSRILAQIKLAKNKTKHGIILTSEIQDAEKYNTQVARVVDVGPLAFKNRNTMEAWPEGAWVEKDAFVRVPKFGGDRWTVKHGDSEVVFVIFNDLDIIGVVTGDPLGIKAFI